MHILSRAGQKQLINQCIAINFFPNKTPILILLAHEWAADVCS